MVMEHRVHSRDPPGPVSCSISPDITTSRLHSHTIRRIVAETCQRALPALYSHVKGTILRCMFPIDRFTNRSARLGGSASAQLEAPAITANNQHVVGRALLDQYNMCSDSLIAATHVTAHTTRSDPNSKLTPVRGPLPQAAVPRDSSCCRQFES